jgi:peroxiredoxin
MTDTLQIPVYNEVKNAFQENLAAMFAKETLNVFDTDARLLALEITSPLKIGVGDKTPLFELPNAIGNTIAIKDLLNQGPVVITFYRGNWCPYCNLVLNTYQRILPEIKALGANLIAISPQTPDSSLDMKAKHDLGFEVLSDTKNSIAKQFTTIIKNSKEAINVAKNLGIYFYDYYDNNSRDIPVPAVFIIDKNGTIVFAKSENGDYRLRVEPQDILDALSYIAE